MTACSFEKVSKSFRSDFLLRRREVLHQVDLEVQTGETFAYLGHNGAGKTTSIKAMLGLIRIDAGCIRLLGHAPGDRRTLARIGYAPENAYFYDHLSGREFLQLVADLHGLERKLARGRIGEVLELVSMEAGADQRMRGYSKGMLQRMGLGQALLNDPELLILDEPMGGLDPMGRHQVRTIIGELKARGKTIFMSSHILADVEAVADRAAILSAGRLRRIVDLDDRSVDRRAFEIQCRGLGATAAEELQRRGFPVHSTNESSRVDVNERGRLAIAVEMVQQSGAHLLQVVPARMGLEEIFLRETHKDGHGSMSGDADADAAREHVGRILDHIVRSSAMPDPVHGGSANSDRGIDGASDEQEVHS